MDLCDYVIFGSMLAISLGLGIWKNGKERGQGASHFLHGGGKIGTVPVSLSMIASFLSSITLLGQPAEVFLYGPQQWIFGAAFVFVLPTVGYFMVPIFREKNYPSAYQYFGERFSKKVQLITSILFTINTVFYLSFVMYAPAIAVNQATGTNTILLVTLMYAVCILYTSLGGITAVVWTDSFQIVVTFSAFLFILAKGTYDIGGVARIWEANDAFNRTNFFDFRLDFTERYTFWSAVIGLGFFHIAMTGGNQFQVQRFSLVSSMGEVRKMLWITAAGWTLIVLITTYAGMLIFAAYQYCDPVLSKKVSTADQLFPLYIIEQLSTPGILGVFLSGLFGAGLSTASTGINSLATIWCAELAPKFTSPEKRSARFVKILAVAIGIFSYLPIFVIPYMGNLVPVVVSFSSIFCGSLFALFMLGMMTTIAEEWGALSGLLLSCCTLSWLQFDSSLAANGGLVIHKALTSSIEKCPSTNGTFSDPTIGHNLAPWYLRISFTWYCLLSALITFGIGIFVSYIVKIVTPAKREKPDVLLASVK